MKNQIRLGQIREEKGYTIKYVAQNVGITAKTLRSYENGKSLPKVSIIFKLARFYNISSDYILGISDNRKFHATSPSPPSH